MPSDADDFDFGGENDVDGDVKLPLKEILAAGCVLGDVVRAVYEVPCGSGVMLSLLCEWMGVWWIEGGDVDVVADV